MCGSQPKPPNVVKIPPPPAPAQGATEVTETVEGEEKSEQGVNRQTLRRFDIRLPASFQIPR